MDEAACSLGFCAMGGLVDIKGFYDHISLPLLFARGAEWGYPAQVLALSMSVYLAPRPQSWGLDTAMGNHPEEKYPHW